MNVDARSWQLALAHMQSGRFEQAEALARAALSSQADEPSWLALCGAALGYQRRSSEAVALFRRLTEIDPGNAEYWSNLGNAQCDAGDHVAAIASLETSLSRHEPAVFVHSALARAYRVTGQPRLALRHASRAVELQPGDSRYLLQRASLCVWLDDWDAGHRDMLRLSRMPLDSGQWCEFADLALQMNLFPEARKAFEAAIELDPGNVEALLGMGFLEERVNALDAARLCLQQAEKWLPGKPAMAAWRYQHLEARLAFRSKHFARAAELLEGLLGMDAAPLDPMLASQLGFDLGSSLDQLGDVDRAWAAFTRAHDVRNTHLRIASQRGAAGNDLRHILESDLPQAPGKTPAPPADGHQDPVFVVGFPRSGTTLLEQMLDAQPGLASFDEQPFLQRLILAVRREGLDYPRDLPVLAQDPGLKARLRQEYFGYVAKARPDLGTRRAVDKNPLNTLRMPLAGALLPGARIIMAIRHPCDVVLSCYMQVFRTPALESSFSSLDETAKLYAEVMDYWRRVRDSLQLPILVNRYEDLVTDPEAQSGRLADFLGIARDEWRHDAIEHALRKGSIRTPSYAQVAEPIHQRAQGRWQRYRHHFSRETLARLEPWMAEFGYGGFEPKRARPGLPFQGSPSQRSCS